jgi:tetratricopeptide (TPR) repeat protein/Zn-dependent protease
MLVRSLLAIVLLIAVFSYPYLFVAWKMTQSIHEGSKVLPANPEDLPAEINEAFLPYVEILEQLDFQFAGYHHIYAGQVGDPPSWGLLFNDSTSLTYACLVAPHPFHQMKLVGCDFITTLEDDRKVHTTSFKDYGIIKGYPREIKQHLFNAPVKELWSAHQSMLRDVLGNPMPLTPNAFLDSMALYNTEKIQFGVERGSYHWKEPNKTYSYSLRSGINLTIKVVLDRKRHHKQIQAQSEAAKQSQVQQEVQAFLASQLPKTPIAKKKRGWIALGSFALFAAVYATRFDPKTLVIFLAALVLHEGGHLLAMIICGYRAPAVLFIPYLGALATARKDHASLSEKFWISLAGPLPGLILGVAIAVVRSLGHGPMLLESWYHEDNIWRNASFILIGLNLFNLLPIYPLDGGQIADLLVFSRNPYLGVVYKSIGVGLLLLLGLVNPLLLVFGLIMALTIPNTFRAAHWFSKLSHELRDIPWQDDEASAQLIFTRLQSAPKLASFQKDAIAGGIFESRRANTASWKLRLGLSLIYLLSLTTGIMGGLYALLPNMQAFSGMMSMGHLFQDPKQHMRENIKKETEAIQRNPKDLEAYERRGRSKLYLRDNQGVIADANAILAQDPKSIQAYRLRGKAYDQAGEEAKAKADEQKANQLQWLPEFQAAQASLKQNPKDVNAYLSRASAKEGLEDIKGAFQDLDLALKIEPKNVDIWVARAGLSQRQDDYQAALRDVNYAIALDPNSIDAYELRSELYDGQGDIEKSEADMAKIEHLYEKTPAAQAHPERLEQIKNLRSPSKQ